MVLGEVYRWNLDKKEIYIHDWRSCYDLIKISDLRTEAFSLEMLRKWRGIGNRFIIQIEEIYRKVGIL